MRCAYFSFQPYQDVRPGGQACASAAMLDGISSLVDVELFYLSQSSLTIQDVDALYRRFPLLKGIRVMAHNPRVSFVRRLNMMRHMMPLSLAFLLDRSVEEVVAGVHNETRFDVVHYDFMTWLCVHPKSRSLTKPTVCSGTDAYSLAYLKKSRFRSSPLESMRDRLAAIAFTRYEAQYLPRADIVHFFSSEDVDYLLDRGIDATFRTTNMPLEQRWFDNPHPSDPRKFQRRILLSGTQAYPWYTKGLLRFLNVVWPQIHAKYPDATLTIHSAHMVPEVENIAEKAKQVQLLGIVNDFREVFKNHDYFVHPLLTGTGQKNRLAVALAQGLCCIASDAAASGMGLRPYEEYIPLTEMADSSIDNILDFLGSPGSSARIAASGRKKMELDFGTKPVGGKLVDIYEETILSHAITCRERARSC